MKWLEWLCNTLWNPWLLGLFLCVGLYITIKTRVIQVRGIRLWLGGTLATVCSSSPNLSSKNKITQVQALATALASTIGTGSIAGVATAIYLGGAGAVFWMWVSAFLGMATSCIEKLLSVHYAVTDGQGNQLGGPMYYMKFGLNSPWLACIFGWICLISSLCGGNLVQANSISTALYSAFGWPPLFVGIGVAIATGLIIWGGIESIGRVSQGLVPLMALLFLIGGGFVLYHHRYNLLPALSSICSFALSPAALLGGGMGYTISQTMRYGIARGVFTNEAGMGTSAIAHGAAHVEHPAQEGMWGIFEVFLSTIVVCTVTALTILVSGVYHPDQALADLMVGTVDSTQFGVPLTMAAFESALGPLGGYLVSLCLLLFAFTSLLGWSYYGVCTLTYLIGHDKFTKGYYVLYLLMIVAGSIGNVAVVWQLTDLFSGLMALPNLIALLLLTPKAVKVLNQYKK